MEPFEYRNGTLHAESVSLERLAERHGTPCYVYSRAAIERRWRAFDAALGDLDHLVCYSVKANSNLAVLDVLARLGSGFDIVSGGELARVLAAGGRADRVVFSGVGKTGEEMLSALDAGVRCFNVESRMELELLGHLAARRRARAPVSLRVNPDVDALTHPYIATGLRESKFGIPIDEAPDLYAYAAGLDGIEVLGVDCHIGSQQTTLGPFVDALERILDLVDHLGARGIEVRHLDLGGGLGVRYRDETPPDPSAYARAIRERVGARPLHVMVEPGRAVVADAGVLLTRVVYTKRNGEHRFAVVDAGMNDLVRPALYGAWQEIVAVRPRADEVEAVYDVVGPVCESADFLGRGRALRVQAGDLLAVRVAGAYGFVMSSNYNSRPRAAEVLVDGRTAHLARARERVEDLFAGESTLP